MRVVGEIPHPVYKITLFLYQDRWTIQIANGPYQFRTSMMQVAGLESIEEIHQFINEPFLLQARDLFAQIHQMTQGRVTEIIAIPD